MEQTQHHLSFRAGFLRIALGLALFAFLPAFVPAAAAYRWLLGLYLLVASGVQLLIWKELARDARALLMGLTDMAIITFLVHRLGSQTSAFVALYVFVSIVYAVVLRRSIALPLAATGAAGYCLVVLGEYLGWLPYAPDAPAWLGQPPVATGVLASAALVASMILGSALLVGNLVQLLRDRERELDTLSRQDPLTRLANRRSLLERLELELARVRRGHDLALLMIDLDGFKQVNDRFGHLRGDDLLFRVAAALQQHTRQTDVVARYGGDEFAVLLPDADEDHANQIARRLVDAVRALGAAFEPTQAVTASVGMAIARPADDAAELLRRADDNGYCAKREGGDRLVTDAAAVSEAP